MNIFGFGSNLPNSNGFNYAPPTPGALLSGVAVSSCPWPPYEGGRFGRVPCNMQFAFSAAVSPPPAQSRSITPADPSPPSPIPLSLPPSPLPRPPPSPPRRPPPSPPKPRLRPPPLKHIVTLAKRKPTSSRIVNKNVHIKRKKTVLRG